MRERGGSAPRHDCTLIQLFLHSQAFDVAGSAAAAAGADCDSVRSDTAHASQRAQELHGPYQRQLKQVRSSLLREQTGYSYR